MPAKLLGLLLRQFVSGTLLLALCPAFAIASGDNEAQLAHTCNGAPYQILVVVVSDQQPDVQVKTLDSGECWTIEFPILPYSTRGVYLYAEMSGRPPSYHQLIQNDGYKNSWGGDVPSWGFGEGGRSLCLNLAALSAYIIARHQACADHEKLVRLGEVSKFDSKNEVRSVVADNEACRVSMSLDCFDLNIGQLLFWASDVNRASHEQELVRGEIARFERGHRSELISGIVPTATGFRIKDSDGPLSLGVNIFDAISETPFGAPIPLMPYDEIIKFGDRYVYGAYDLLYQIFRHGQSEGYQNGYEMTISRNEAQGWVAYNVKGGLFFDEGLYGNVFLDNFRTCKVSGDAALLGFIEEASFYTQVLIGCLKRTFYDGARRGLRQCSFERRQILGAYKQFCSRETFAGEFIGGFYMPGRKQIEKLVFNKNSFAGVDTVMDLGRIVLFETSEEAIRSIIVAPPGLDLGQKIEFVKTSASIGALLSVGFRLMIPR